MGLSSSRDNLRNTFSEAVVEKKQKLRYGCVNVDVVSSCIHHSRRGEATQYVIPGSFSGLMYGGTIPSHSTVIRRASQAVQETGGEPMYIPLYVT